MRPLPGGRLSPSARPTPRSAAVSAVASRMADPIWLRTNGLNTNGAAAKIMNFDRLGKNVRPGTFGKIKVG